MWKKGVYLPICIPYCAGLELLKRNWTSAFPSSPRTFTRGFQAVDAVGGLVHWLGWRWPSEEKGTHWFFRGEIIQEESWKERWSLIHILQKCWCSPVLRWMSPPKGSIDFKTAGLLTKHRDPPLDWDDQQVEIVETLGNGFSNGIPPRHHLSFSSFLKGETKTVGGGCPSFLGHQFD